jgi:hypothetical protein
MTICYICGKRVTKLRRKVAAHHRFNGSRNPPLCDTVGMPWDSFVRQIERIAEIQAARPMR